MFLSPTPMNNYLQRIYRFEIKFINLFSKINYLTTNVFLNVDNFFAKFNDVYTFKIKPRLSTIQD